MTPLMHAAYKGKADLCCLLLQHGADVNCNQHEFGYTALMFAALSGTFMVIQPGNQAAHSPHGSMSCSPPLLQCLMSLCSPPPLPPEG